MRKLKLNQGTAILNEIHGNDSYSLVWGEETFFEDNILNIRDLIVIKDTLFSKYFSLHETGGNIEITGVLMDSEGSCELGPFIKRIFKIKDYMNPEIGAKLLEEFFYNIDNDFDGIIYENKNNIDKIYFDNGYKLE